MKRREFQSEVSKMSAEDLKRRGIELSEELMKLRFRKASGRGEKSHLLRELRRNVARVLTQASRNRKAAK